MVVLDLLDLAQSIRDGDRHAFAESTAAAVKQIYRAVGVAERMEMKWGDEGHKFYPQLIWPFVENALK